MASRSHHLANSLAILLLSVAEVKVGSSNELMGFQLVMLIASLPSLGIYNRELPW